MIVAIVVVVDSLVTHIVTDSGVLAGVDQADIEVCAIGNTGTLSGNGCLGVVTQIQFAVYQADVLGRNCACSIDNCIVLHGQFDRSVSLAGTDGNAALNKGIATDNHFTAAGDALTLTLSIGCCKVIALVVNIEAIAGTEAITEGTAQNGQAVAVCVDQATAAGSLLGIGGCTGADELAAVDSQITGSSDGSAIDLLHALIIQEGAACVNLTAVDSDHGACPTADSAAVGGATVEALDHAAVDGQLAAYGNGTVGSIHIQVIHMRTVEDTVLNDHLTLIGDMNNCGVVADGLGILKLHTDSAGFAGGIVDGQLAGDTEHLHTGISFCALNCRHGTGNVMAVQVDV